LVYQCRVTRTKRWFRWVWLLGCLNFFSAQAQIDPVKRESIQLGYNAAFEGHAPLAGYAYYYRNQPDFLHSTNLTLRLALAPVYLDSELGIRHALGQNTDLGIGLAGGGFADSYEEIRGGQFLPQESFTGHDAEASLSVYHLFNPGQQIPLNGVLRGTAHYSVYSTDDRTATGFQLPEDHTTFSVRTGLRWGGREPTLFPSLAMAVSIWYEGMFRTDGGVYGFGDRRLNSQSHLFWGEAMLAYTLPELKHTFYLSLTAGTSVEADRFSSYRLGALLPMVAEFPLSLPGYYYQEISARNFVLIGGNYIIPLDHRHRWNFNVTAATAVVSYLSGLEQPGDWHTGLGAGILYNAASWKIMLGYGYGVDAIRSRGRGANSIGFLLQFDLEHAKEASFNPAQPYQSRGLREILDFLGH
jgi:hypothetical protein